MELKEKGFRMAYLKELDLDKRQAKWVISTSSLDRDSDRLDPQGCITENYVKNPVVLVDHKWTTDSIVATNINIEIGKDEIIAISQFPPDGELKLSDDIFKKISNKLINAVSVGFRPLEYEKNAEGGYNIISWELLEYSFVAIPANPEALRKEMEKNEEEEEKMDEATVKELITAAIKPLDEKIQGLEKTLEGIQTTLDDLQIETEINDEETE